VGENFLSPIKKAENMQIPMELKPAFWGAVGGAAALAIVGFSWGGWVTANTADTNAKQRSEKAVVAALAPICVEQFRANTNASANLEALRKVSSWQQGAFVSDGGWATMPGSKAPVSEVASACAELLRATQT
jgi:hypothetical protein